ncbi:hypothetical protein ACTMU2_19215 [Cupriavidus basilensis]
MPKGFPVGAHLVRIGRIGDHPRFRRSGQQPPTVNLNGYRYGASVFLGVTVPICDGGLRSAVLAQARSDADSASTEG